MPVKEGTQEIRSYLEKLADIRIRNFHCWARFQIFFGRIPEEI